MARLHEYKRSVNATRTFYAGGFKSTGYQAWAEIKTEFCDISETSSHDIGMSMREADNDDALNNTSGNERSKFSPAKSHVDTLNKKGKALSGDHAEIENRKRKWHDSYSPTINDNCKRNKSSKKSGDAIGPRRKKSICLTIPKNKWKKVVMNKKTVPCDICFLKFYSTLSVMMHKNIYRRQRKAADSKKVHIKNKYACHFCVRTFRTKAIVQSHLFHCHAADLTRDLMAKDIVLSGATPNGHSDNSQKEKKIRQTTLVEYLTCSCKNEATDASKELSNKLNITDDLLGIIKQEIELSDERSDTSLHGSTPVTSHANKNLNQPFVKIHMNSDMMKALMVDMPNGEIDYDFPAVPAKSNNENIDNDNTRGSYKLRSLSKSKKVNTHDRKDTDSELKNKKALSMCKKCTIPLIRCDDESNASSISQIRKKLAQISKPINRKVKSNSNALIRDRNIKLKSSISKSRISKNRAKRGPVGTGSPKSKGQSKSNSAANSVTSNPKLSTSRKALVKNFKKRRVNRSSLRKKVKRKVKRERTSGKENVKNSDVLSPQEEPISTEAQNILLPIENKLKELAVSLIRLPEIKKEVVRTDAEIATRKITNEEQVLIPCTLCGVVRSSERKMRKHIKRAHTAYKSSICRAKCTSRRYLLRHYLRIHSMWGSNTCCVCQKLFQKRALLKRHLLLHCIKVVLTKGEQPPMNKNINCNAILKMRKRIVSNLVRSSKFRAANDIRQEMLTERVNANKIDNIHQSDAVEHEVENEGVFEETDNERARKIAVFQTEQSSMEELIANQSFVTIDSSAYDLNNGAQIVSNIGETIKEACVAVSTVVSSPKLKYPCSICGLQFQKLNFLLQHTRTYTQSVHNSCPICGMFFSHKKILKRHIQTTHDPRICSLYKFHCQFCNQGFRTEYNLRIHELHYHATAETIDKKKVTEILQMLNRTDKPSGIQTMCDECGCIFTSYERYQLHRMYYYKGHMFPCRFCDQVFQGLYMLHHHNKFYHYPPSTRTSYKYHCSICYEGFVFETHYHAHMSHLHSNKRQAQSMEVALSSVRQNYPKKSYVCSKCHHEFSTTVELMVHVEHYSNNGNYRCQRCHRKCCTLAILNEHINLTHGNNFTNGYKCMLCNEVLISSTSLFCHQKHVHQPDSSEEFLETLDTSSYKTRMIEEGLINDSRSKNNDLVEVNEPIILIHSSTSPVIVASKCKISCPICALRFEKELYLKEHLAEYLDVGDYKCDECQRRFGSFDMLRKHTSNHVKPGESFAKYYCNVCNENFQSSVIFECHVAHLHARVVFKDMVSTNV